MAYSLPEDSPNSEQELDKLGGKSPPPPPPPPRRSYLPGSGLTTTRSGDVVYTGRKESMSKVWWVESWQTGFWVPTVLSVWTLKKKKSIDSTHLDLQKVPQMENVSQCYWTRLGTMGASLMWLLVGHYEMQITSHFPWCDISKLEWGSYQEQISRQSCGCLYKKAVTWA